MSEQLMMKMDMVKNLALLLMNDNPQMTIEQALATVTYIAQETEVSGFRFSICRLDYVVL